MTPKDRAIRVSQIHDIVNGIPRGKAVTYGCTSKKIYGRPNCGSAVGSAIKKETSSKRDQYPWWRVVGKEWYPLLQDKEDQIERLKKEDVEVLEDGRVAHSCRHGLDEKTMIDAEPSKPSMRRPLALAELLVGAPKPGTSRTTRADKEEAVTLHNPDGSTPAPQDIAEASPGPERIAQGEDA